MKLKTIILLGVLGGVAGVAQPIYQTTNSVYVGKLCSNNIGYLLGPSGRLLTCQNGKLADVAGAGMTPVIPASSDVLNCNTTTNMSTTPASFATTWTMPAFTQTAGSGFSLNYDLLGNTSGSAPTFLAVLYIDGVPWYVNATGAIMPATAINYRGAIPFRITASTIGAAGSVNITAPNVMGLTPTLAQNRALPQFLNGTFSSTNNWVVSTNWAISGGAAVATTANAAQGVEQVLYAVPGQTYTITYTVSGYSQGTVSAYINATVSATPRSANGTYTDSITVPASGGGAVQFGVLGSNGTTFTGNISNISIGLPTIDTTVSHTVSLGFQCSANTALNTLQLLDISAQRVY